MIESLEREIQRPASVTIPEPTGTAEEVPSAKTDVPVAAETPIEQSVPGEALFKKLKDMVSDRSAELGKCFASQVYFVSYADNILTWESCADDKCKQQLRHGFSVIKQFVRELFGFETQIKHLPCTQPSDEDAAVSQQSEQQESEVSIDQTEDIRPASSNTPQSASMTADIETGSGSCVTGECNDNDEATKEFDGHDILNEPMVQKAKELFEATKITVQSKV